MNTAPHFRINSSRALLCGASIVLALTLPCGSTFAQAPATPRPFFSSPTPRPAAQSDWPFGQKPSGTTSTANQPPPREIPLIEKKLEEISSTRMSRYGEKALAISPEKWKHAETENFVLHYRRVTEAQKVAREVEYDLYFIATALGATRERYSRKSHVYIFEDEDEWKQFLALTAAPSWSASFARGDELFLNVRRQGGGFGSTTLAHEASHAVVARLFPGKRWPLWLNEGFAEYMGGASVAARKGQSVKRYQSRLQAADMPLSTMEALTEYPDDEAQVAQLYQTSEKFVRFLMNELPKERMVKFIDAVLAGTSMKEAVLQVYGDKFSDWDAFVKRYARFNK